MSAYVIWARRANSCDMALHRQGVDGCQSLSGEAVCDDLKKIANYGDRVFYTHEHHYSQVLFDGANDDYRDLFVFSSFYPTAVRASHVTQLGKGVDLLFPDIFKVFVGGPAKRCIGLKLNPITASDAEPENLQRVFSLPSRFRSQIPTEDSLISSIDSCKGGGSRYLHSVLSKEKNFLNCASFTFSQASEGDVVSEKVVWCRDVSALVNFVAFHRSEILVAVDSKYGNFKDILGNNFFLFDIEEVMDLPCPPEVQLYNFLSSIRGYCGYLRSAFSYLSRLARVRELSEDLVGGQFPE